VLLIVHIALRISRVLAGSRPEAVETEHNVLCAMRKTPIWSGAGPYAVNWISFHIAPP
jgi:hypothetical protein